MFQYEHLIYTPAFYFLIALTLALTFGYTWGRRWNRKIVVNALDPLLVVFKARDQQFTNISGETGFHANIVPGNMRSVRRIDVTLTILPRQSWLYMPFSLLVRKFDRMQNFFYFNKRGKALREEAHLIDVRFEKMMGNRVENVDTLECETVRWGDRTFHLYSASSRSREWLLHLKEKLGQPSSLRHVAIVPEKQRAYLFCIPKVGTVAPLMETFRDWLDETATAVGKRSADPNGADDSIDTPDVSLEEP